MLNLYLKPVECIRQNDVYFNRHAQEIQFNNKNIKAVMKLVDAAEYVGNYRMQSWLVPGVAVSVRELSTGCKTALNVASFSHEIFSVDECGNNALQVIYKYKRGNIALASFMLPLPFENQINVITNLGSTIVNNNEQLEEVMDSVF